MTTQALADILVKCGIVKADEASVVMLGRIAEAAVMVSAMEADLVSTLMRPGRCAHCGNLKPLPYRRDDLGGYVCLTCVENHLNAWKACAERLAQSCRGSDVEARMIALDEFDRFTKEQEKP